MEKQFEVTRVLWVDGKSFTEARVTDLEKEMPNTRASVINEIIERCKIDSEFAEDMKRKGIITKIKDKKA